MSSNAPAVPAEIAKHLQEGDLDAVEDAWMARMEKTPADLDFFSSVAAAVAKADTQETAAILLQMLDDELKEKELWPIRIELLRREGRIMHPTTKLHSQI
ncbi:MAG: hypothetical protein AAGF23_06575, partial [Acidobacteriota bacterium]